MAISDKIESIENHLKADYNSIEKLVDVNVDKNIENIASLVDSIYDKFPKTDFAEGSNITLSNTLKGKLDFENDIVGYGQTEQKSYDGYNELNLQDYTETINGVTITIKNGVIMLNGNSTNYTTKAIPQATSSQFNGEYNLNYEYVSGTTNNTANLNLYNGSEEIATLYFGNLSRNQSVTFNEDTISIRIYFHNNAEFNNYIIKPMLYKGAYDSTKTFEPYVGGTASPNPSYKQEIEVVRGKNLFDKDNANILNANLTSYTNISTNSPSNRTLYIPIKPNTTYTISKIKTSYFVIGTTTDTPTINMAYSQRLDKSNTTSATITTSETAKYLIVWYYNRGSDTGVTEQEILDSVQIEVGDTATSYLPYNTLEIEERGKNLVESLELGEINSSNGAESSSTTILRTTNFIEYDKTKTYYQSVNSTNLTSQTNFRFYNKNKEYIGYANFGYASGTTNPTITIGNSVTTTDLEPKYFRVRISISTTGLDTTSEYMIANDSDLTYEPYQEPKTYQLSLGEYEFAKIGNYVDTIEYDVDNDKVYKNENIIKRILDGTESISSEQIYVNLGRFNIINYTDMKYGSQASPNVISNCYISNFGTDDNSIFISGNQKWICIMDKRFINNLNGFKQWLSTNKPIIYYVLATPIRTEITGTLATQIKALYYSHSFTGTTIIEIDGQLPLVLKVRALKGN